MFAHVSHVLAFAAYLVCSESAGDPLDRNVDVVSVTVISAGFHCKAYTDKNGRPNGYVLFVPQKHPAGKKLPVLLFLNGAGENGNDGVKQISNNFGSRVWEMQRFFPFLAVAPQCRESWSSANGGDMQAAIELLDRVVNEFGADPDRIYVTGVSAGGDGVWHAASRYPDRFAAIVPLCAAGGGDMGRLAEAGVPVWIFNNELDSARVVNYNRSARKQLIELGQSPLVTEYHELGHDCWNRAYRSTAMYGWLKAQNWERNKRERKFDYWPAEKLLAEWSGVGEELCGWKVGEEGLLIGRGESRMEVRTERFGRGEGERRGASPPVSGARAAGNVTATMLVSNVQARDVEIHADLWLSRGSDYRVALRQDDTPGENGPADAGQEKGLFVSIVLPDAGTGGVVTVESRWLARLDPAAQRMLQVEAWNDVRVKLAKGRLTVVLNGWQAVDVTVGTEASAGAQYRCALVAPNAGSEAKWRYVRTRMLEE